MKITVDDIEIQLPAHFDEYIELMCAAVKPPATDRVEMVRRVLVDNFASNIQQHPEVRPKVIDEELKAVFLKAVG